MDPEPQTTNPELQDLPGVHLKPGLWDAAWREAGWTIDVFLRLFASVLVLRAVTGVLNRWFPKGIWDVSPSIVRGFGKRSEEPRQAEESSSHSSGNGADYADRPEFLFADGEERFYAHRTRFTDQLWPCPLLRKSTCFTCPHFVHDLEGNRACAAAFKVLTRKHPRFTFHSLSQLREFLSTSMGGGGMHDAYDATEGGRA